MNVRPDELSHREFYRILISAVVPRPIAWVSTLSGGRLNLAPFSFFNVVSAKPPLLGFSPSLRQVDGRPAPKDTLYNIRETGEFVVNVVTFAVAEAMNLTSGDYESSINEFEVAKLADAAVPGGAAAAGGTIASQLRVQGGTDNRFWQRAAKREPGDRRDRQRSHRGECSAQMAGSTETRSI